MIQKNRDLRQIVAHEIPDKHPIHSLRIAYEHHNSIHYHLPDLNKVLGMVDKRSLDYCIILEPVTGDAYLDFAPISKGRMVPGIVGTCITRNELYTHGIADHLVEERLMELASSIVLRSPQFSHGLSARRKSINVNVFRAVFPVWQLLKNKPAVILAIAPPYAETSDAGLMHAHTH